MDVEDDPSLADPSDCADLDVEDSDLDYAISESDSELNSEFDVFLDSDEEMEILEDVECIQAISKGSQLPEGNTRNDNSGSEDDKIQAVFDKAAHALHTILNETSSTLNILTLHWTSYRPLQIHTILAGLVLPFLDEFYLYRCSIVEQSIHVDPPTTALLPRLRRLVVCGDWKSEHL